MYWVHEVATTDLLQGNVFVHGTARINIAPLDIRLFIEPPDAAYMLGLRALEEGQGFDAAWVVWFATLCRRENGPDSTRV